MEISPNEVDTVTDCGTLDNKPVKLVRCKGGFYIAIGKKKGSYKDEVLAAGSHPAVVKYSLEKQNPGYQPMLAKSEGHVEPKVERHSRFLTPELIKTGHDIYSVENGGSVEFCVTKHNVHLAKAEAEFLADALVMKTLGVPKEFLHALSAAAAVVAISRGVEKIKTAEK